MSLTRIFALGLALTFITGIAGTAVATAKELRFPEIGDVAFVMDVPDNWVVFESWSKSAPEGTRP